MSNRLRHPHFEITPKAVAEEWLSELRRRLDRSAELLNSASPDPGFFSLQKEIRQFATLVREAKKTSNGNAK
jgi:hypothetical protein